MRRTGLQIYQEAVCSGVQSMNMLRFSAILAVIV